MIFTSCLSWQSAKSVSVVFSIFEVLGSGKHSTVYKGRKKNTIIYYAIKSVEKDERAKVLQEVWHASRFKSLTSADSVIAPIVGMLLQSA